MPLDVLFFHFVFKALSVDSHVVHVDRQPFLGYLVGEDRIHHCLECGRRVGESEEHDCVFE
jgi:hypothetical protein